MCLEFRISVSGGIDVFRDKSYNTFPTRNDRTDRIPEIVIQIVI